MSSLGLDIGGANLKFFCNGSGEAIYFPMWKKVEELEKKLMEIAEQFKPDKAGVVITAELSDVFKTKAEGIKFVEKSVKKAFSDSEVYFLDVEGKVSETANPPKAFAASNWVASVSLLAKNFDSFILADMGSTTTDLIPFRKKILAAKTDYERLKRGELIYIGILRTPVFHVLPFFTAPLVPELFAITADVFTIIGDIGQEHYTCETPDGGGKSAEECMQRIARQLCCDLEDVGRKLIRRLAEEAKKAMIGRVEKGIVRLSKEHGIEMVIGCGIGEFLLEEATRKAGLEYVSAGKIYGKCSSYFPAYAMARLVENI